MVLVVLSHHADNNGCNARPGIGLICKESKLCERAVKYAIKSLIETQELGLEYPSRGQKPASYSINLPIKGKKGYGAPDALLKLIKGAPDAPVHQMHPKQGSGVQMATSRGANGDIPGVQMATLYGANGDIAYKEGIIEYPIEKPIEERESSSKQEGLKPMLSPLSLALCEICKLNPDLLSPIRYSDLIAAEKKLSANQRSPDEVREFGRRWFANDWRGLKGDAPSLTLVLDEWERVMSANGPVNHLGETWEQEKARRIREEKQREGVAANGRNGWKF